MKEINIKTIGNWSLKLWIDKEKKDYCLHSFKVMIYSKLSNTIVEFKNHNYKIGGRSIPKKILQFANHNYNKLNSVRDCLSSYDALTFAIQNNCTIEEIQRRQYAYNYFLGKVELDFSTLLIEAQYHIYKLQRRS